MISFLFDSSNAEHTQKNTVCKAQKRHTVLIYRTSNDQSIGASPTVAV